MFNLINYLQNRISFLYFTLITIRELSGRLAARVSASDGCTELLRGKNITSLFCSPASVYNCQAANPFFFLSFFGLCWRELQVQ